MIGFCCSRPPPQTPQGIPTSFSVCDVVLCPVRIFPCSHSTRTCPTQTCTLEHALGRASPCLCSHCEAIPSLHGAPGPHHQSLSALCETLVLTPTERDCTQGPRRCPRQADGQTANYHHWPTCVPPRSRGTCATTERRTTQLFSAAVHNAQAWPGVCRAPSPHTPCL